jgi:glycosyltransferase involved in cell wall biosynthesis
MLILYLYSYMKAKPKIAIFHAFFDIRGGAEELVFNLRNHLQADLYCGGINWELNNNHNADYFNRKLFDPHYRFSFLHHDSRYPLFKYLKRVWFVRCSRRLSILEHYDVVIVSGNVAFLQTRLKRKGVKLITYCNSPPRKCTDMEQSFVASLPWIARPFFRLIARWARYQYTQDILKSDVIIANSHNIVDRLQSYLGVQADTVIFPPVTTSSFKYISTGDYFISYARLEEIKRITLIVEAFAQMPEQKLIICSSGTLEPWVLEQIRTRKLQNIMFKGRVDDQELRSLVGNCLAGITIPINEDAGMTQCELMAAGKPVIGVAEGGLLETVIDGKTGVLIPAEPTVEDVIQAVQGMTAKKAISMRQACEIQAQKFDEKEFYLKIDQVIASVL